MLAGSIVIGAGGAGLTGGTLRIDGFASLATPGAGGLVRVSSLELQLEIPNAANKASTRTVPAIRVGVHNDFPLLVLFMSGISYLLLPESEQSISLETTLALPGLGTLCKPERFEDNRHLSFLAHILYSRQLGSQ